jgi:hypothetical protein
LNYCNVQARDANLFAYTSGETDPKKVLDFLSMQEQFVKWLNRLLIFDVFLVIGGFVWFIIAVIGKSAGIPLGFDLFYQLWLPVFNPAISILIAGAILNWGIHKFQERFSPK